ncbi:MAG: GntR family transcriptional regulator [Oscillospiraceae bacterium]
MQHLSQNPAEQTRAVIYTWKGSDPRIMCSELSRMYQRLADSIESTLQELAGTMPEFPVQTGTPFSWNPMRGQDYYYSKIVDDLNMKIGLGEYAVGTYLPYEKQLAGRYGVSLSTVRKALSELEQRGFVKTFNGKGTVVIEPDGTKLYQLALNSGYVEKALRYLHALQLMVLVIRPAVAAAQRFTGEELDGLADRFAAPGSIPLAEMFEAIVKHTTLVPLRVILVQTNRLLGWGHHFAYYPSRQNVLSQLNKKVIEGLGQLREGNTDSFADTMADCYRAILVRVKNNLVKVYRFQDAEKVRIPQKY